MNVEAPERDRGEAAGRLHTGRSRNDQVAVDFRLWVRECDADGALAALMESLIGQAEDGADWVMPDLPTRSGAALDVNITMAYAEMLPSRDRARFADARKRMNESSLGRQHWLARLSR
jgi:argininosuccinate lyase